MLKAILKKNKKLLIVLIVLLVVMIYAWFEINRVDAHFQYAFRAPALVLQSNEDPNDTSKVYLNDALKDARLAEEEMTKRLEGACQDASLYVVGQPASVSVEDGESVSARLVGIQQGYAALKDISLYFGRLIYPDEFFIGERVAMIDEQLAVALFKYAEPLKEELVIAGQVYRIIGIVRDHKQVGDEMDYSLYVPYRALEKSGIELTELVYEARPVKGAGGWSAFESAVETLGAGGTVISLSKERMNAAMPLRLLVVICGAAVGLFLIRMLNRLFARLVSRYKEMLIDRYAARLLWWAGWRGFLLLIGYAICALIMAQVFVLLIDPVYTFPEWIPTVLVEPKDIQSAFWNVWQKSAKAAEWRTPELLRLRFYRELLGWTTGAAVAIIGCIWGRMTPPKSIDEYQDEDY